MLCVTYSVKVKGGNRSAKITNDDIKKISGVIVISVLGLICAIIETILKEEQDGR